MTKGGKIALTAGMLAALVGGVAFAATRGGGSSGGTKPSGGKKPGGGSDPSGPGFNPWDPGTDNPGGGDTPGGGGGGGGGGGSGGGGGGSGGGGNGPGNPKGGYIRGSKGEEYFGKIAAKDVPKDWSRVGNTVIFASDCSVVLVGASFWPMTCPESAKHCISTDPFGRTWLNAIEPADGTVKGALRIGANSSNPNSIVGFVSYALDSGGITSATQMLALILEGLGAPCIDEPSSQWPPAMKMFANWLGGVRLNEFMTTSGGNADFEDIT